MIYKIVLVATILATSLIAGLFYSYSCSVNPGLKSLSDIEYLRSMQSINRAILNPVFFASFMGALLLLPICTWLAYREVGFHTSFYLLLAALIIYAVGTFGVTIACNVPLNNALDRFNIDAASFSELQIQRTKFEMPWNRYHAIRTIANVLSLLLTIIAGVFK